MEGAATRFFSSPSILSALFCARCTTSRLVTAPSQRNICISLNLIEFYPVYSSTSPILCETPSSCVFQQHSASLCCRSNLTFDLFFFVFLTTFHKLCIKTGSVEINPLRHHTATSGVSDNSSGRPSSRLSPRGPQSWKLKLRELCAANTGLI